MEVACLCSTLSGALAGMMTPMAGGDFHPGGTEIIWSLLHSQARLLGWDDEKAGLSQGITQNTYTWPLMWPGLSQCGSLILIENIPRVSVPRNPGRSSLVFYDLAQEAT